MATVNEIIADAKATRRDLADLEQELQEEIDAIRFRAFQEGRAMTAEEQATRNERRAQKAEAQLKQIAGYAETAAKVADGIAKVAEKVVALAA